MQKISSYLYSNRLPVNLDLATSPMEWRIVYQRTVKIYKGYDLELIKTQEEKAVLLEIGEIWWWESNRQIPINIFCRKEIEPFKYAIKTFNSKDVRIVLGPTVNLLNMTLKRVKRKSVQLVRSTKR